MSIYNARHYFNNNGSLTRIKVLDYYNLWNHSSAHSNTQVSFYDYSNNVLDVENLCDQVRAVLPAPRNEIPAGAIAPPIQYYYYDLVTSRLQEVYRIDIGDHQYQYSLNRDTVALDYPPPDVSPIRAAPAPITAAQFLADSDDTDSDSDNPAVVNIALMQQSVRRVTGPRNNPLVVSDSEESGDENPMDEIYRWMGNPPPRGHSGHHITAEQVQQLYSAPIEQEPNECTMCCESVDVGSNCHSCDAVLCNDCMRGLHLGPETKCPYCFKDFTKKRKRD